MRPAALAAPVARAARVATGGALAMLLLRASGVHAQAGPPFLTNDPGTPGNMDWEINLASMATIAQGEAAYQVPQVDLNFGLGERVQLTYEVPYVLESAQGQGLHGGWSNAYPGIKWRFLDGGEAGWNMSVFPQVETSVSRAARDVGIGAAGPRYLLPVEVAKKLGPIDVDVEAGYYVAGHGRERILGAVAGAPVTDRLELDVELYDDRPYDFARRTTTWDGGGRYVLKDGVIALFMAGRSFNKVHAGQPEFIGYLGIQLLIHQRVRP